MTKDQEWRPRHVNTADLPKGYDAADLIESGVSQKEFLLFMKKRLRPGIPPGNLRAVASKTEKKKQKSEKPLERHPEPEPVQADNVTALRKPQEDEPLGVPPEFSEDGLAERFTEQYSNTLKFCKPWAGWMVWDDNHWRKDDTAISLHYSRQVCKRASSEILDRPALAGKALKIAESISSRRTIANVEAIARTDRRHVISPAKFDSDPWLLNTPDGIVDLRTGEMRKQVIGDYVSKMTAVSPGGKCPTWMKFLQEATNGDEELEGYLKRIAGYCLTGSIAEHAFFFLYGTGGNGKGIFKDTLDWILNSYARVANIDTFTEQRFSKHSSEIAYFQGARLVTATETSEGSRWAEARIKAMTGGDPITANFMHQNPFTFYPLFKLLFTGNHKPQLRNVDEAIKRRLYLIPFEHTVPAEQRDIRLPEKIKAEASGVLQWMIDGCLEWQNTMLDPPKRVIASTSDYLETEDRIGAFLEDHCVEGPHERVKTTLLYSVYRLWAETEGDYALSSKRFYNLLRQKGFEVKKQSGEQVVIGLSKK
jgi:putative DNA primase/helicase